jgi:hypothetical protein
MLRLAVLASFVALAPACRLSLEDGSSAAADSGVDAPISAACQEATMHSDLAWIENNVFKTSCIFSGCHNGAMTDAGRVDLRVGMSHSHLVNFASGLDGTRMLVVPNQPNQSYLLMMVKHIAPGMMSPPASEPPATVGYMPQNAGGAILCVQKRDAIQRWIEAGAQNN